LVPAGEDTATTVVRQPTTAVAMVLAPMLVAMAFLLVFTAGELIGVRPFSYQAPSNLAEAAGMGSMPEVLRFIRQGADSTRVENVRPDIISSEITKVTAPEAAIWSRRVQLVRLMEREGAFGNEADRPHLACLARALNVADIVEYLTPAESAECDPDQTIAQIAARGR
jgi:hypothetical protein